MTTVTLPGPDGSTSEFDMGPPRHFARPDGSLRSRRAFAAAHVVADPLGDNTPGSPAVLDWDATLGFRRHLWSWGLPVADAMDTAQRGMGMDWPTTRELIQRSCAEAAAVHGQVACGAATDQLPAGPATTTAVIDAYLEQVGHVESCGGQAVMMASRQLAHDLPPVDIYSEVYGAVLAQTTSPVILHWLGEMFDPALRGYWGSTDLDEATTNFLTVVTDNRDRIDGVKISLLDGEREKQIRQRLPTGVRTYTGDDFAYPDMILGDGAYHSDAFLGAFDLIAPAASAAVQALDQGDVDGFRDALAPTVPLARHVFGHPTYFYKTGIVFMAFLNGHQDHFRMVHGLESSRSVLHLATQFRLASGAGLFPDPDLAAHRMAVFLELAGCPQRSAR